MSADGLIDAAEDSAIWAATHPDEAHRREAALYHWAATGHVTCECPNRFLFSWEKGSSAPSSVPDEQ